MPQFEMMTWIDPDFVERCQILYEKDPNSKVFAPLAEAYRRMGLLDAAYDVCSRGVQMHPEFAGGRVSLAKIFLDQGKAEEAVEQLRFATELSPENILAHALLGQTWLALRKPKEALSAYKMVLLLNPADTKAQDVVRKLESLSADEFEAKLFQFAITSPRAVQDEETGKPPFSDTPDRLRALERYLSLADAFIVRSDLSKAWDTLKVAQQELGPHPEITSRYQLLSEQADEDPIPMKPIEESPPQPSETKPKKSKQFIHLTDPRIARLELLLQRINQRRFSS